MAKVLRDILVAAPGVALCCVLALGGEALVAVLGLPLPGAVLGLGAYAAWLVAGRGSGWSRPGATLLVRWIGAMVVPALVSLEAQAGALAGVLLPLALLLVTTTLVTAAATVAIFRLAGGRG